MYFESIQAIIHMGGHGAFVWSAYGISLLVVVGLIAWPQRRYRQQLRLLASVSKSHKPG